MSTTAQRATSAQSGSFARPAFPCSKVNVAFAPNALVTFRTMRSRRSGTSARSSGDHVRTVPVSHARPAMMFRASPPWNSPTVTTTGSNGETSRLTSTCSDITSSAPTTTASTPLCGIDPCALTPSMSTRNQSVFAMRCPGAQDTSPASTSLQMCAP